MDLFKAVVGRLNPVTRKALEEAAALCVAQTHYNIEVEHFLTKLLDTTDSDFSVILKQFGVDRSRLAKELSIALDKMKRGNSRGPGYTPTLVEMLSKAWTIGSLEYGAGQIRSGFCVLALLADESLARITREISKELQKIDAESLRKQLPAIMEDSFEYTVDSAGTSSPAAAPGAPGAARPGG